LDIAIILETEDINEVVGDEEEEGCQFRVELFGQSKLTGKFLWVTLGSLYSASRMFLFSATQIKGLARANECVDSNSLSKNLIGTPQMNAYQSRAAFRLFSKERVSVILGPPGTGKTQTIAETIKEKIRKDTNVLSIASSNSAAYQANK
jgi:primosomal protein N'